ncbi:MAG TPA: DUF3800 domain-containing protein [Bacteroidetes bacterium]|nr:DUF3800 domain-containing protein [Bacteroidota bacterium]
MKFCYCDESGTGNEPFAVMASIVVDSQRMHRTKRDWNNLLATLSTIIDEKVTEFHTRDFYPGNGPWRKIDGPVRAKIITVVLEWLKERKHKIIYCAINKEKWRQKKKIGKIPDEINSIWKTIAYYTILGIQKQNQKLEKTKGHSILIFDNEEKEKNKITDLVLNPPAWSDSFYNKKRRQERLSHVVDVPYWGDSREVALIQVADFISFFIRRYIELKSGSRQVRYDGENTKLDAWYKTICNCSVSSSIMLPSRGRCEIAELLFGLAPECMK